MRTLKEIIEQLQDIEADLMIYFNTVRNEHSTADLAIGESKTFYEREKALDNLFDAEQAVSKAITDTNFAKVHYNKIYNEN